MTQQHETPEEHSSVVGGSTASRRIGCPRSYTLEQLVPADTGNVYTREGTALHEMIAVILDKDKTPEELLPFTFKREEDDVEGTWEFTVTPDIWYELGQPALDAWDAFVDEIEADEGATLSYDIETRCEMAGIPGAFGTADVLWRCGTLTGVWDWKFGRTPVDAMENKQLMFYARAAAYTAPHWFGPVDGVEGNNMAGKWAEIDKTREVILSIMQPRVSDEPSEYIVTVEELEAFRLELRDAVKEAQEKGARARIEKGPWCGFATCKAVCPFWAGQTATFGEKMARLAEAKQDAENTEAVGDVAAADRRREAAEDEFAELLPELLDMAEAAEDWIKSVRNAAFAKLGNDEPVDGWRLGVSETSKRVWAVDEEQVKKFFKNRRYKLDDFAPRKVLTMPQGETLLKKDKKNPIPEEMIEKKTTSKLALVREDSSLGAPELTSERAMVLGSRLAALRGE